MNESLIFHPGWADGGETDVGFMEGPGAGGSARKIGSGAFSAGTVD